MNNNDIPEVGDIADYILDGLDDIKDIDGVEVRDDIDGLDEAMSTAGIGTPEVSDEADAAEDATLLRLLGSNIPTRNPAADLLDRLIDPSDAPSLTLERRQHLVASVRERLELRARNRGLLPSVLRKYRESATRTQAQDAVALANWVANLGKLEGHDDINLAELDITPRLVSDLENGKKPLNTPEITVLAAVWAHMQGIPLDAARNAMQISLDTLADDPFVSDVAAGVNPEGTRTGTQTSADDLLDLFTQAYQATEEPGK